MSFKRVVCVRWAGNPFVSDDDSSWLQSRIRCLSVRHFSVASSETLSSVKTQINNYFWNVNVIHWHELYEVFPSKISLHLTTALTILWFLSISPARSHGNAAEIPEAGPIRSASVEVCCNTDIPHNQHSDRTNDWDFKSFGPSPFLRSEVVPGGQRLSGVLQHPEFIKQHDV